MSKRYSAQEIGDAGETEFLFACERFNSLFCTRPSRDRLGWDLLVEVPADYNPALSLSSQPSLSKSFVQVKSKIGPITSIKGKLSAFKLLVETDMPCFIAAVSLDQDLAFRNALLLHIGESQIQAILKKICVLEARGRTDLHNYEISLPIDEAKSILNYAGDIKAAIETFSALSLPKTYAHWKNDLRLGIGYQPFSYSGSIVFADESSFQQFVDVTLGITTEASVSSMRAERRRFSVRVPTEDIVVGPSTIQMEVVPIAIGEVFIISRDAPVSKSCLLPAKIFAPGIPDLPKPYHKLRIAADWIEFVVDFGRNSVQVRYSPDADTTYRWRDLAKHILFNEILCEYKTDIYLRTDQHNSLIARLDERICSSPPGLFKIVDAIATAISQSPILFDHRINLKSLLDRLKESPRFSEMLMTDHGRIKFFFIEGNPLNDVSDKKVSLSAPMILDFSEFRFSCVAQYRMEVEESGPNSFSGAVTFERFHIASVSSDAPDLKILNEAAANAPTLPGLDIQIALTVEEVPTVVSRAMAAR